MKTRVITLLLALLLLCLPLVACRDQVERIGSWEDATYLSDEEFGKGERTVQVEVKADDQSITFTIHTDKDTLADAMLEHELIEGEDGPYGLFLDKVNGISIPTDSGYYWGLYQDGEMTPVGISSIEIADGDHYELVKTNVFE